MRMSTARWGAYTLLGSIEATGAPPNAITSQGQEERYSGYFSCFVTRKIITCLPAPLPDDRRRTLPTVKE